MSYRIAGINVHKKMLAVVVSDVEVDGEYQFELRRFYQQKAQHGTTLLSNVSQSAAIPAGVFQRHQSEIAGHLLPALKAVGFSDDEHEGQCGERTNTGMGHQSTRFGTLLHFLLDRLAQFRDRR